MQQQVLCASSDTDRRTADIVEDTATKSQQEVPLAQPDSQLSGTDSVATPQEDKTCRVTSLGLLPRPDAGHKENDHPYFVQPSKWDADSRSQSTATAWDDSSERTASQPESVTWLSSAKQPVPLKLHQASETVAFSSGSTGWESCQSGTDADGTSHLSSSNGCTAKQSAALCMPQESLRHSETHSSACSSPVAAAPSFVPPGMPVPPFGSPPQAQVQTSGSRSSDASLLVHHAGSDALRMSGVHVHVQQQSEHPQSRRSTTDQGSMAPEYHQAEPEQQQHGKLEQSVRVPRLQQRASSHQPQDSSNCAVYAPEPEQAGPQQLQAASSNHDVPAYKGRQELSRKQQQVPNKLSAPVPGVQQAQTSSQQQADAWDDSDADPPFITPVHTLQRTANVTTSRRSAITQQSHARKPLANVAWEQQSGTVRPEECHGSDPALEDGPSRQHHITHQHMEESSAVMNRGHAAFPAGLIQPGMDPSPPSTPSVDPVSAQSDKDSPTPTASALQYNDATGPMRPNGAQPSVLPQPPPGSSLNPTGSSAGLGPWPRAALPFDPPGFSPSQKPPDSQSKFQPLPAVNQHMQKQHPQLSAVFSPLSVQNSPTTPGHFRIPATSQARANRVQPHSQPISGCDSSAPLTALAKAELQQTAAAQPQNSIGFAQEMHDLISNTDFWPAQDMHHHASCGSNSAESVRANKGMRQVSAEPGGIHIS